MAQSASGLPILKEMHGAGGSPIGIGGGGQVVAPGSYLDMLYVLIQQLLRELQCRNVLAGQAQSRLVTVPVLTPGVQGLQLVSYSAQRLGLVIVNMDPTDPIYISTSQQVNLPPNAQAAMPLYPQEAIVWNLNDADRNLPRFAGAPGPASIQVSITEIT